MKGGDAMSTFMSPISDHSFESYREDSADLATII